MRRISFVVVSLWTLSGTAAERTPSPALVVLNKTDNAMAIVNPTNGKVVATIPVGRNPHEAAVSDDGKLAFASNMQGNSISVIDLIAQKELHRVDLPNLRTPHGLRFADGKLYFTAEGNNAIARYDPVANLVDWTHDSGQSGTHMLVVTNDLSKIFTSNMGSDSIGLFERPPASPDYRVKFIPVGRSPEAIALSPDGRQVWTAKGGDSHLAIIDVVTGAVTQKLPIRSQRINRLQFTADGKHVLLSDSSNGDVIVLDAISQKEIKRLKVGSNSEGILITPDGSRAYVASEQDNFVGVLDLQKFELTGRIHPGNGPDGMAWAVQK